MLGPVACRLGNHHKRKLGDRLERFVRVWAGEVAAVVEHRDLCHIACAPRRLSSTTRLNRQGMARTVSQLKRGHLGSYATEIETHATRVRTSSRPIFCIADPGVPRVLSRAASSARVTTNSSWTRCDESRERETERDRSVRVPHVPLSREEYYESIIFFGVQSSIVLIVNTTSM